MQILILGLVLWTGSHLFKRLLPGLRSRMGDIPGKMFVTILSLAAIGLMVAGYRRADPVEIYQPLPGMGHLNNLLMLGAVFLTGLPHSRGILKSKLRHPMLMAVVVWAIAHLLVNGDLASVVLFGWLGLWAIISMTLINMQTSWTPPPRGHLRSDLIGLAISLAVFAVIAGIHSWLGYNPFRGTYS